MSERERMRDEGMGGGGGAGGPDGDNPALEDLQDAAGRLLRAGEDAIDKALSGGHSEKFLAANRQEGGQ